MTQGELIMADQRESYSVSRYDQGWWGEWKLEEEEGCSCYPKPHRGAYHDIINMGI
jgi:hypothetical protein